MGLSISKNDMKMIAASGGLIGGGQIASNSSGGGGPVGTAGAVAKSSGMLGLTFVGAHETFQMVTKGQEIGARMYGKRAAEISGNIMSSARRAAPGLKLLAGKIAHGANKVI